LFSCPDKQIAMRQKTRNVATCLLIFGVVAALYATTFGHPFSDYDDDYYVTENPHVRAGLSWQTVGWAFSSGEDANWHPLTWISHELDVELFGMQPGGHHATSVLLHALNAVLLFLLVLLATGRFGPSLVVALLFGIHPINVESAAWVAERKNVLSTFFFFLTLGAYGWYVQRPSIRRYAAVLLFFACSLMAKPMLVTLPFVLLLLDYWPLERLRNKNSFWSRIREKIPLFALSFVSCVITYEVQRAGRAFHPLTQFPLDVRLENAILAYALYLWKAVWPAGLAVFYPHPGRDISALQIGASVCALSLITLFIALRRRKKYLLVGWLWFFGTMIPVIGIVQVGDQAMADRYAYIPLIGVFLAVIFLLADYLPALKLPKTVIGGLAAVVLIAYSFASIRQIGYWSSSEDLWTHALAVTANNSLAHRKLGWDLLSSGDPEGALDHFRRAAEISPNDPTNHVNLGLCLDGNHEREAAISEFRKAISLASDPEQLASAYTDLGIDLDGSGNTAEAQDSYNHALQFNPRMFNTYFDRGILFEKQGQMELAIQDYQRAVQLQPSVQGYLQLSHALQQLNRVPEAQLYYEKARRLAAESRVGSN
jgi:tetratricopeptide (TPR) repeat protein